MTHSGGKPHTNIGDHGQRYEVRSTGYPKYGADSLHSRKSLLQKVGHAIRTYLASIMAPISEEEQRRMAEW